MQKHTNMVRGITGTPVHHQNLSYDYAGRITSTCVTPDAGGDAILSEYIYNAQSFLIVDMIRGESTNGLSASYTYSLGGNRRTHGSYRWDGFNADAADLTTSTYTHGTVGIMPTDHLTQFVSRDGDVTAPITRTHNLAYDACEKGRNGETAKRRKR